MWFVLAWAWTWVLPAAVSAATCRPSLLLDSICRNKEQAKRDGAAPARGASLTNPKFCIKHCLISTPFGLILVRLFRICVTWFGAHPVSCGKPLAPWSSGTRASLGCGLGFAQFRLRLNLCPRLQIHRDFAPGERP